MRYPISSDKDAEDLLLMLEEMPDDTFPEELVLVLDRYIPRHLARFLGGVLQHTTQMVVVYSARLLADNVALEDAWPEETGVPRQLTFRQCSMDAAFLDTLLFRWLPNVAFEQLVFSYCRFVGQLRSVRALHGKTLVNKLCVAYSDPNFAYYIGIFTKLARIRELVMNGVNATFVDWLPSVHHKSLQSLELYDIVFDDASTAALADFLRRAHGLATVQLGSTSVVLPDAVAAAIGAHPRKRIDIYGNMWISEENLDAMLSQQTALTDLVIPSIQSQRSFEMIVAVIRQNPFLKRFYLHKKRGGPPIQVPPALAQALLRHPRINDVYMDGRNHVPGLSAHLANNIQRASLFRDISVATAPLSIVPVLVTGALRDVAYARLSGPASSPEQQVARAIVRANRQHAKLLRTLLDSELGVLLGDELRAALNAPPPDGAEVVAYTASVIPPAGFPGGVRVFAPRPEEMTMAAPSFEHTILVSDEPCRVSLRDKVVARYAQMPWGPIPLRDQLCLLAVMCAPKDVLSADEVADICAKLDDARLPANPYTYALPSGHVIARMPAVLEALRKTFALPAQLAQIVNRVGHARTDWFHSGVLPTAAIANVFNHVLESSDVPADEVVRILTTFDVIFPIPRGRAVFPKFRHVPPAVYRALAFLLSHDPVRVLSMDDDGSIAFIVTQGPLRGERMVARYADGALAVTAETVAASDIEGISRHLNRAADL